MEIFIAILSIATSVLCIILFFKVWGMCNDVDVIAKTLKSAEIPPSELLFLASVNDPTFKDKLARAIFVDLRNISRDYEYYDWEKEYVKHYKFWEELCNEQGWQFPEAFAGKKTNKEFRVSFMK